jgi:Holliday junction resolvase RusA-like endonuclease
LLRCVDVDVTPVAAVRPKVTKWSTYYPGEYGRYLPALKDRLRELWLGEPLDLECRLEVKFWLPRPKSHYRTGRNNHLVKAGAAKYPHQDVDNLLKGAMDAASGVLYVDDRLVVEVCATKGYGSPRLRYELSALESGNSLASSLSS